MNFPMVPHVDFLSIAPDGIVALFGVLGLLVEIFRPQKSNRFISIISLIGLLLAAAAVVFDLGAGSSTSFGGMALHDGLGAMSQLLLILVAIIAILVSEPYLREKHIDYGEFNPLLLWCTAGGMVMATSTNLLVIFLGLEVLSISLYVLCGLSRNEEKSGEAATKYFLLGAFSSGFFLFGIAMVYGATGQLDLNGVVGAWRAGGSGIQPLLLAGFALLAIGMCFKSALVPFHQWAPDVYVGAPTNVTVYMSTAAKVAAFAVFWRVTSAFAGSVDYWLLPLALVAAVTMLAGNLMALVQSDVKRILAYSSISHAGYILVDVLAHAKDGQIGYQNMEYYLLSYGLMTVGAFAVLTLLAARGKEATKLSDLNGLWKRNPIAAVSLLVFMMSLIGLPPFSGFFGKVFIFSDAIHAGLPSLAIVLAISSVISAAYYLSIARAAFVDEPNEAPIQRPASFSAQTAFVFCAVGVVAISIFIGPIQTFILK